MKNGALFLGGLFAAFTASWAAVVLCANAQLGGLTTYYDDAEGNAYPLRASGIAAQGELVYRDLGCAACHTQQVRRPDFGSDQKRGWGDRQSVARDYLFQAHPQLGALRFGPDLANFGARKPVPEPQEVMKLLYAGSVTHPSYRFLFTTRRVAGERSARALDFGGRLASEPGYELLPTPRADALVAYLFSLKQAYEFPEARPAILEKPADAKASSAKPGEARAVGAKAGDAKTPEPKAAEPKAEAKPVNTEASPATETSNPPGKRPEQAVPAAAPDEKKKQTK